MADLLQYTCTAGPFPAHPDVFTPECAADLIGQQFVVIQHGDLVQRLGKATVTGAYMHSDDVLLMHVAVDPYQPGIVATAWGQPDDDNPVPLAIGYELIEYEEPEDAPRVLNKVKLLHAWRQDPPAVEARREVEEDTAPEEGEGPVAEPASAELAYVLGGVTHRLCRPPGTAEQTHPGYEFVVAVPREGWLEFRASDGRVYRLTLTEAEGDGR